MHLCSQVVTVSPASACGPATGIAKQMHPTTFSDFRLVGKKVPSRQLTSSHLFIPADCHHRLQLHRAHQRPQPHAPTESLFFLKPMSCLPSSGTIEILRGIIACHEGMLPSCYSYSHPTCCPQSNWASS